jgi:hypothetical protein
VPFGRHFAVAAGGIGPALSLINNKISFCSATAAAQRVFSRDINYLVSLTVKDQLELPTDHERADTVDFTSVEAQSFVICGNDG